MQYIPTKFDQGSFVAKDVVFGATHIDSPVSFTLVTNIAPQVNESIGTPPVVESVLFDSPVIQMVFEIDNEKAWLYRELQKAVMVLHGLVPIRCFELNQFLYPIDENYNIYAGVSSVLHDQHLSSKDTVTGVYDIQKTRSRLNLDNFLYNTKTKNKSDIDQISNLFFDSYTPFFNVVNKETVQQSNGKITCVLYIQPVNMFSYFKDGIAYFIKDDIGIIKQEIINRYVSVHGLEQLDTNTKNMIESLNKIFNGGSNSVDKNSGSGTSDISNVFTLSSKLNFEFSKEDINPSLLPVVNTDKREYQFFTTDGAVEISPSRSINHELDYSKVVSKDEKYINPRILSYRDLTTNVTANGDEYFPKKLKISNKFKIHYEANYIQSGSLTSEDFPRVVIDDGDTFKYLEEENSTPLNFRIQSIDTLETPKFKSIPINFGTGALSDGSRVRMHLYQLGVVGNNAIEDERDENDPRLLAAYFILAICQGYVFFNEFNETVKNLKDGENISIRYNEANHSYGRFVGLCPNQIIKNTSQISLTTNVTIGKDYNAKFKNTITNDMIEKSISYLRYKCNYNNKAIISLEEIEDYLKDLRDGSPLKKDLELLFDRIINVNKQTNIALSTSDLDVSTETELDKKIVNSSLYVDDTGVYSIYEASPHKVKLHKKAPMIVPFKHIFTKEKDVVYDEYPINFAFVNNVNSSITTSVKYANIPRTLVFKLRGDLVEKLNAIHLPTVLLSKINRDFRANNKAFLPDEEVPSNVVVKNSVSYNIDEIQQIIKEIYTDHVTIYPELSKPYKKFLNCLDEFYIKDNIKYRYTDVDSDLTYPLLYTSNMTMSKMKRNPSSDVALSYISKNIANVRFIDVVKNSLYEIFFSGENQIKGLIDEYRPTTRTSANILSTPNNYFINQDLLGADYIDTIGSIFTDIMMLSSNAIDLPGQKKLRLLSSLRTSVNQLMTNINVEYSTGFDPFILDFFTSSNRKELNNILGYLSDSKVQVSNDFLSSKNMLKYKDVSDRLMLHITTLLNGVVVPFVTKMFKENKVGIESEEYFMFIESVNTFIKNITDFYKKSRLSSASDTILKFEDAKNCDMAVIYESISNTSIFNEFTKFISYIESEITAIVNTTPINFIKKRIVISDSVLTSITAISHNYSSMNTPISNSDSSIGTFFQCIQQPSETASILITTSDYNLMRQLLLINYSQNMNNDQIVKTERLRTSGSSIQDNKKVSILMDKIEKLFDDITSPDTYSLDGIDLSMNIGNDFLNSYGVKYVYINSINIMNVENRAGVYNVQVNVTKTIPKRIVNNYLKTTEKSPLLSSTMSSLVARYLTYNETFNPPTGDYKPEPKITPENEYIENHIRIVGESSLLSLIPIGTIAYILHSVYTRDKQTSNRILDKLLKRIPVVVLKGKNTSYKDLSFLEVVYAFLDAMCSADLSELLTYLYDLKSIMQDFALDYGSVELDNINEALTLDTFLGDIYDYLRGNIYSKIRITDEYMNVQHIVNTREEFRSMVINTIEDMITMCSSNDLSFIRTLRSTAQMLIFGYKNLCFSFKFSNVSDEKVIRNIIQMIGEVYNHLDFSTYLLKLNGKKENNLLKEFDKAATKAKNTLSQMLKITETKSSNGKSSLSLKVNSSIKIIDNNYVNVYNAGTDTNLNIRLKIRLTPSMIRAVSTMYDLINKYGYLSFDYVDDFFEKNDLTDTPLTKTLIEFMQVMNTEEYVKTFIPENDGIRFDSLLSNGAKSFMFEKSHTENNVTYRKTNFPEIRAYQHFMSKLSPISQRREFKTNSKGSIVYDRKTKTKSYDSSSYLNLSDESAIYQNNIFDNTFSNSFIAMCNEMENLVCTKSSDGYESVDKKHSDIDSSVNKDDYRKNIIREHNSTLFALTTNKINGHFLTHTQKKDSISNRIDIDRIRPIESYLKSSLLGSCYYISQNIGTEFFKNNSMGYSLGTSINYSFIKSQPKDKAADYEYLKNIEYLEYNQYDIIVLLSALMHFGTMGINNPYASSYFESSHSLAMPIVYAFDKKDIVTLMGKYTDIGINSILTTILIGNKINQSPSFFITEDFQNTWAVAYLKDLLSDISQVNTFSNDTKKNAEVLISEWVTKHKDLLKETLKSVNRSKTAIKSILRNTNAGNSRLIDAKLDTITNDIMSINPFILDKPRAIDSQSAIENQKRIESAQKSINELHVMVERIFGVVTTDYEYQTLSQVLNSMISNVEKAARSSKIIEVINIVGQENLIKLVGFSLPELEKGFQVSDWLPDTNRYSELNRETFQIVKNMLTDILYNNSEINKLTVNNTSKLLSMLKNSTKENNNIISLRSAFPIVKVLITKRGIPGMLVFDDYYAFSSINSINIFSNVDSPSSIAEIYFSDPFNDISQAIDTPVFGTKIKESMTDLAVSSSDNYAQHTLAVGTGIQIRMGYNKNLDESSIIFNGQVEHLSMLEGKMVCGSSASTLLKPLYPTDMNIVVDSIYTDYEKDPTDSSIAFDVTSRLLKLNPSAFDGIYSGITESFDQAYGYFSSTLSDIKKQYQTGTRSWLSKVLNKLAFSQYRNNDLRPSDIRNIMYMNNVIQNNHETFENFKPVRISTDIHRTMPNFVYLANTPTWNSLQELQNHYPNHVLLARPFDNRETLIFKHASGLYKTTNSFCHELLNVEKIANHFKTFGQENDELYKKLLNNITKYVDGFPTLNKNEISDEYVTVYAICKLIYDVCAIPKDGADSQVVLDRTSLLDNFVNQNFEDLRKYMRMTSNSDEISKVMNSALAIIKKYSDRKSGVDESVIAKRETFRDLAFYVALGVLAGTAIVASGGVAAFFSGAALTGTVAKIAAAFGIIGSTVGASAGASAVASAVVSYKSDWDIVDNTMTEYNLTLAMNTIYESILSVSKNYRNISVTHVIDSSNIITNDVQLLRNGNSLKMSSFNKESVVGTYTQAFTNVLAGPMSAFVDGNHIERINYNTNDTPFIHNLNFSKRKISNLNNPGNWITYNYTLDRNIPEDKMFSIYTSQPNAEFLETAGVKEQNIVASSIIKKMLQEYYGGTITIFGNSNVFVGDKIYIDDKRTGIAGVVEVREVLHSFSPTFGYTTTITPSMIVSSNENVGIISGAEITMQVISNVISAAAVGFGAFKIGSFLKSSTMARGVLGWLNPIASKGASFVGYGGKLITGIGAITTALSIAQFSAQTMGRMNNYFTGTMSILVDGNQEIDQSILCLNKNGVPYVSNMEGLNFAHILNEQGHDSGHPYHRWMMNKSGLSSEVYFDV